ncbi:MAG: preprotein translocase subunit YajC [Phocaeicola sp.]|nr:preprotein translocase subunit YajC [Prevotellaceae bacterium]MDY3914388.1 preprotein translocase subunit YajC [Phocaeicola sp.]
MNVQTVILQAKGGFDMSFFIMMALVFGIMYFFMIRPQQKKQKELNQFRNNLEIGQAVITAGGIYGKIKEIEDTAVVVEIASGVKIKVDRNSIFADAQAQSK